MYYKSERKTENSSITLCRPIGAWQSTKQQM